MKNFLLVIKNSAGNIDRIEGPDTQEVVVVRALQLIQDGGCTVSNTVALILKKGESITDKNEVKYQIHTTNLVPNEYQVLIEKLKQNSEDINRAIKDI